MSQHMQLLNPETGVLHFNIEHTASLNLPFAQKNCLSSHYGAVVCGTGPTLLEKKNLSEIRRLYKKGYKIFAVKQAIRLLADEGITPHYSVAMDPTERQIAKTPINKDVTYVVASSCHPRMFEYLLDAGVKVEVFHSACGAEANGLCEMDFYQKYFPENCALEDVACGGFTVVNRAVALAEYMGAKRIYVAGAPFGWRNNAAYYAEGVKEAASNATGPTLSDKALVDGKEWFSKADLLPSAASLARKAKAQPNRFFFIGDSLAASLAKRNDDFLERVVPTKQ